MYRVQIKTKQMNEQKKGSLDFENTIKEKQKELERLKVETELEKTKIKNLRKSAKPSDKPKTLNEIIEESKNARHKGLLYNSMFYHFSTLQCLNSSAIRFIDRADDIPSSSALNKLADKFKKYAEDKKKTKRRKPQNLRFFYLYMHFCYEPIEPAMYLYTIAGSALRVRLLHSKHFFLFP